LTMRILIQNRQRKYPINTRQIRQWVSDILKMQNEEDVEIGLVFVNNRTIQRYNRDYRGKDTPTDVLSFPIRSAGATHAPPLLGDIMISLEKTYEEAPLFYRSVHEQLLFLSIHGILHLLGYDHEQSRNDAMRMKRREKVIFEAIYKTTFGKNRVPSSSP
ncbi:MAG: rRNA maturation RNase YbeY, partial [Nitrospirae bacterium]|nr:rRNA maturation RNase YbeY [Candidatus Troglogloeales bacterium]